MLNFLKKHAKKLVAACSVCALSIVGAFAAFAEETPIVDFGTQASSLATTLKAEVTSIAPTIVGVVIAVMSVTIGLRLFKKFGNKAA